MPRDIKKVALFNEVRNLGYNLENKDYNKYSIHQLEYLKTVLSVVPLPTSSRSPSHIHTIPEPPVIRETNKARKKDVKTFSDQIRDGYNSLNRKTELRKLNESDNKPDEFLTRENKKFSVREFTYYDVPFKVNNVSAILQRVFGAGTILNREYYITVFAELKTTSTDGDGAIDERIYNVNHASPKGMKYNKATTNSQLLKFVDEFFDEAIARLIKMQKDSKTLVEYDDNFNLRVLIKEITSGGTQVGMLEEYEHILFNPKTEYTCFIECLKKAGVVMPNMTVSDIYKKIGKKTIEPVSPTQINKFLKVCDTESKYAVMVYKFKEDGTLPSKGNKHLGESKTGERQTIHLLLHKSHYMLSIQPTQRSKLHPDGFWDLHSEQQEDEMHSETIPLENVIIRQDPMKTSNLPKKLDVSTETWFWDMEALQGEVQHRKLTTKTMIDGEKVNKTMTATEHIVYNVGYCKITDLYEYSFMRKGFVPDHKNKERMMKSVKINYGMNALDEFITFLRKLANDAEKKHDAAVIKTLAKDDIGRDHEDFQKYFESEKFKTQKFYQQTFVAYNSGRYDHYLILKNKVASLGIESVLFSNGILSMTLFGYIKFTDFYRHTMCSLAGLCKSFDLDEEYSKSSFPHDFMSDDKLEYVGPIPEEKYWPDKKIPSGMMGTNPSATASPSAEGLCPRSTTETIETLCATDSNWNLKDFSIYYQKLDVISMGICYMKYCRVMYKITGFNAPQYLTTPALSYAYITHKIQEFSVKTIKNLRVDTWMRQAIIGGRCFVQKRYFKAEKYDEINRILPSGKTVWDSSTQEERGEFVKQFDDGLCDFDGVSLYPSAMSKYQYPVGDAYWVDFTVLDDLKNSLNNLTYDKLSIVECDIHYPNKNLVTPLIAEMSGPRRVYTCHNKTNIVLSSVDLEEAIKYNGAVITKVHKVLEWAEKAYVFKEVIDHLFNERLKAKSRGDSAFSTLLKLLMNSGYGKFEQKLILTDTKICDSNEMMEAAITCGAMKTYDILNEDKVILELNKKISDGSKQFKPVQMGIFILAYSKRIMNEAINAVGGFESFEKTFFYTDTDSMIITTKQLGEISQMTNEFGDSFVGNQLGQLHDDLGDEAVIIQGLWIQPKLYCLEYLVKEKDGYQKKIHVRSKGVNLKQNPLSVADFEQM
jgi:hypothetical protein